VSDADHCNSSGGRLSIASQIVRQDRANVHRRWHLDPDDTVDSRFDADTARAELERQLIIAPAVAGVIVSSDPVIGVYEAASGFEVTIVAQGPRSPAAREPARCAGRRPEARPNAHDQIGRP